MFLRGLCRDSCEYCYDHAGILRLLGLQRRDIIMVYTGLRFLLDKGELVYFDVGFRGMITQTEIK